ncbi:tautomerase family protein [Priestia aryabhattai]|uniref:tautomerase family protein n=1 Tax=Priestia megaterium TaxID=1404 RepID=UPI0039B94F66
MPFFTVNLCSNVSSIFKQKTIYHVTNVTSTFLNIPPDKIQVLIQEFPRENWGRAGTSLTEENFSKESRAINWETKQSYYSGDSSKEENMTIVTIDVWDMYTQEQKNSWVEHLTEVFVNLLEIPKDNILILIRDMPAGNWGQNGVTGAHANFLEESRLIFGK